MSHYCTPSSCARVEHVSSASRARASVNWQVDGTVANNKISTEGVMYMEGTAKVRVVY